MFAPQSVNKNAGFNAFLFTVFAARQKDILIYVTFCKYNLDNWKQTWI